MEVIEMIQGSVAVVAYILGGILYYVILSRLPLMDDFMNPWKSNRSPIFEVSRWFIETIDDFTDRLHIANGFILFDLFWGLLFATDIMLMLFESIGYALSEAAFFFQNLASSLRS